MLHEGPDGPDANGAAAAGEAATADLADRLRAVWPLLQACAEPGADLRLGVGARTASAEGLRASLCQARFALTAADEAVAVRGVEQLDTLAELLSGVPPEVRGVYVNTVHYRIERVEALTGRDLSRLDHKLDLYAALRC
ncbi:helix-turn-helix domain-containing protein [Streptomyces sp. NBC_00347]|uniref:helix-turn-helix domain-containing protein n=2 Tax=unclassified Streptomyces TaxID=2593676 RepID=UPI0022591F18|nr:helix-turn-helix domain-containing protein [Streptomyces sp. NBC_00347]MCX5124139.1 helix-turn-helix domain-containing protein [Streptomyces sp. NBC_00347]